jgi:hypothetical protein
MGAPVLRSDDSEPFKREPPNDGAPVTDAPQRPGPSPTIRLPDARLGGPLGRSFGSPSGRTTEAVDPPRKPTTTPKPRYALFEGDAAAIELRSRLAKTRDDALLPASRDAPAPAIGLLVFGAVLRFTGIVLTAAAVAGVAGYVAGGGKLSFKPARIAGPSGEAPPALEAQLNASNRNAPLPPTQTAAIERPGPPAAPLLSQQPPPLPPPDASEVAARLKLGAEQVHIGPRNEAERDVLWRQFMIWRQQQRK